jgi:23S rRNA pseudouridine955/2504/2580 synthase/23S rRNA pseudouridine1911/1915/1917 synthase
MITLSQIKDSILFENDFIIACNKPSGVLSIPDRFDSEIPAFYPMLQQIYPNLLLIHRLDRDTSGVIVFAKNTEAQKFISEQLEKHTAQKLYWALAHGSTAYDNFLIDEPIAENTVRRGTVLIHARGKKSMTSITTLYSGKKYSWLKCTLHSGRQHQIRVHLKHIGHSVIADEHYGSPKGLYLSDFKKITPQRDEDEKPLMGRLALHAYSIMLKMPNGQEVCIETEMPKDFKATINQLKKMGM